MGRPGDRHITIKLKDLPKLGENPMIVSGEVKRVEVKEVNTSKGAKNSYRVLVGNTWVSTWDAKAVESEGQRVTVDAKVNGNFKNVNPWVTAVDANVPTAPTKVPSPTAPAPAPKVFGRDYSAEERSKNAGVATRMAVDIVSAFFKPSPKSEDPVAEAMLATGHVARQFLDLRSDLVYKLEHDK